MLIDSIRKINGKQKVKGKRDLRGSKMMDRQTEKYSYRADVLWWNNL